MTTTTMNFATTGYRSAQAKAPLFAGISAMLAAAQSKAPLAARPLHIAARAALAAVPFAALAWMFVSF